MAVEGSTHLWYSGGNMCCADGKEEEERENEMMVQEIDETYWKKRAMLIEIHFHLDGKAEYFSVGGTAF